MSTQISSEQWSVVSGQWLHKQWSRRAQLRTSCLKSGHWSLVTGHWFRGFTLLEILITVVIVGILASIGIPNFLRTIERGYRREAQDLLLTIYSGERAYLFNNGVYLPITDPAADGDWDKIFMANPNVGSIPVEFTVPSVCNPADGCNPPEFTVKATRDASRSMTINEKREFDESGGWTLP